MPHSAEEPQIHESVPGRRGGAGTTRTPQASRTATPLPGPRPSPRPAPPRSDRNHRPGSTRTGATRGAGTTPAQPPVPPQARVTRSTRATAEIQLVAAAEPAAVEAADEAVDRLLDEGRAPGSVLVLTTGGPHPWAEHEMSFGEERYWRQLADDEVFCAHTSAAARTGGRPVVVLAVNGGTDEEIALALPTALEKAGERLVVCGAPERLGALL